MATTNLTRTPGSTGSTTKATLSAWVKKADITTTQDIYSLRLNNDNQLRLRLRDNGAITIYISVSNSTVVEKRSTRLLRDTSGWYHVVLVTDLTESAAEDKYKIYINNERITSWAVNTNTSATSYDYIVAGGGSYVMRIGSNGAGDDNFFSGSMSHFHFSDGYAYAPTVFGETDATTGEWKINTSPTFTPGTNGFTILKDGNTITDQSSNSNDFTLGGGTLTNTEDCPSDVFATLNPLVPDTDMSFINGNNTQQRTSGTWDYSVSTLGANTGKYYFEGKIGGTGHWILGATPVIDGIGEIGSGSGAAAWRDTGDVKVSNASVSYGGSITYTSSDVVCVAMDKTNNKIYFRKNGDAWINSGDPTSGATGTGAFDLDNTTDTYFFGACSYITSGTGTWDINFGNGTFGTTAISSEGTNASNIGKFEYDVPTGYTALSTKGLNS